MLGGDNIKKLVGVRLDEDAVQSINNFVEFHNKNFSRKIVFSEMLRDLIDIGIKDYGSKLEKLVLSQKKSSSVAPNYQNVGRNSPCPCGSGKKYKHCHGK